MVNAHTFERSIPGIGVDVPHDTVAFVRQTVYAHRQCAFLRLLLLLLTHRVQQCHQHLHYIADLRVQSLADPSFCHVHRAFETHPCQSAPQTDANKADDVTAAQESLHLQMGAVSSQRDSMMGFQLVLRWGMPSCHLLAKSPTQQGLSQLLQPQHWRLLVAWRLAWI